MKPPTRISSESVTLHIAADVVMEPGIRYLLTMLCELDPDNPTTPKLALVRLGELNNDPG